MNLLETRLRERIDVLTDERDRARALQTDMRRRLDVTQKRLRETRASRDMWRDRYRAERWFKRGRQAA